MSLFILIPAVVLTWTVLAVTPLMAQQVEDKEKVETEGSAAAQDVQSEQETEGQKTDKVRLKIKEVVIVGDKIGRPTAEAPPSITIVEGEQAEQAFNRDVKHVIRKAANVFAEEGAQLPAIRGVDGSAGYGQSITAGTQPRIPLLIDDVARPLQDAFSISRSSTWDVSTMEIARGPQPSSTGRNALAGAIRIYTNNPKFEYEASARLRGYTADGTADGAAMVNLPLIDNQLAFRATVEESRGDAYINVTGGTENFRGKIDPESEIFKRYRGKLLFTPDAVPGLQVKFTIDHMRTAGPIPGNATPDGDPKNFNVSNFASQTGLEENDQTTFIGRMNYVLNEFADLELRGSFIDNDLAFLDTGSGVGQADYAKDQVEGEAFLRLSDLGVLKRGLVGIIHNVATEDGSTDEPVYSPPNFPPLYYVSDGKINNTGFYAEAEIALDELGLADGLTLIAGGRYEIDDRHRSVIARGSTVSDRGLSARRFQPKVGLRYAPHDDLMLGYTYSESFRAGGTDFDLITAAYLAPFLPPGVPIGISEFDPETMRQHELFAKSSLWNRRVSLGASAFYYTYDNAQVQGATQASYPIPFIPTSRLLGNVPETVGYGIEIEATADLTAGFSLNGALGLLKTEITDAGPVLKAMGNEGGALPRAPSTTANLALNYDPGDGFTGTLSGRFVGRTTSVMNGLQIPSYTIFDLSTGYEFQDGYFGDFRVDLSIENLTDKGYFIFRDVSLATFEGKGRPRTFMLSGTWRF